MPRHLDAYDTDRRPAHDCSDAARPCSGQTLVSGANRLRTIRALDGDVILEAKVATMESARGIVATTNVGQLSRYVEPAVWSRHPPQRVVAGERGHPCSVPRDHARPRFLASYRALVEAFRAFGSRGVALTCNRKLASRLQLGLLRRLQRRLLRYPHQDEQHPLAGFTP